ncbi:MAG: SUMF1/EgtB/PvdO family nonheme iron enzyme [Anaerolineae bacterium]|nr:SUMF1/EgtB/PvdO family nonheme iron enzyme [Anaerolineae bacterium]
MRSLLCILNTIMVLLAVITASCQDNATPSAHAEHVTSTVTATMTLPSPELATPTGPVEASPTVPMTSTLLAATAPTVAATKIRPACTVIGQTWTSPIDGVELVCVPAGEFLMGAAETDLQADDDEKPQHQVYLDAFWIDRTEVTNANFLKCIDEGACQPEIFELSALTYTPYAVHPDYQDFPVLLYEVDVAAAYCQWAGRRLPTEAEWEKAARGTDGRRYPWGNTDLDCTKASYFGCENTLKPYDATGPRCGYSSYCRTTRVDDYLAGASPYGALNMVGNVWEWVADKYSPTYYAHSPSQNPTGPSEGEFGVRRGGGTKSLSSDLRVTSRASGQGHHYFDGQMGFRCAVSAGKS